MHGVKMGTYLDMQNKPLDIKKTSGTKDKFQTKKKIYNGASSKVLED